MADDNKNTLGALRKEKKLRDEILQQKIKNKAATEELTAAATKAAQAEVAVQQRRLDKMRELALASGKYTAEQIAKQEELLASRERQVASLNKMSSAQDKLNKRIDSYAASLNSSIPLLDELADSGLSAAEVAGKMKAAFSDANGKLDLLKVTAAITAPIFEAVRDALYKNVTAVADMTAEVAGATGEGTKYNAMIADVGSTNRQFGVGMVEAGKAVSGLRDNMSTFNMVGEDASRKMVQVAARMENLKISAADSGAMMEYSIRIMGQSGDQAAQTVDELAKYAGSIGVAPQKMAKEFQAASPALASYGKNATKVFTKLLKTSKKLGIEMNDLISITSQFDTFDGAFDAAGQFNALMGGPFLDSMQLVNATEAEREQILRNAVKATGQSFDAMSRHEQMALANSLGITDMSVAMKMFSEDNAAMGDGLKETSVSQEELAERQKAAVSFTTKLEMAMQGFAVALMPVAEMALWVGNALIFLTDNPVAQFALGAATAIYMLVKAIQIARAAVVAYTFVKGLLNAAEGGGIVMKSLSAAKNYILAGSQAAVAGTAGPAAAGMAATATAGGAAAAPLAALGVALLKLAVAVLLIGVGVGVLAAGMSLLVNAFTALLQLIIDNIKIMPQVIISLYLLAIGFQLLGISLLIAGVGMYVFAASLLTMVLIGVPAIMAMLVPMFLLGLAIVGVAVAMLGLAISVTAIALGLGLMIKILSNMSGLGSGVATTFGLIGVSFAALAVSIAVAAYTVAISLGILSVSFVAFGLAVAFSASMMVPAIMMMFYPMLLLAFAVGVVSASMIVLGASIVIIAFGLGLMVKNFSSLGQMLPAIAANFTLIATAFGAMAASIVVLGVVMGTFGGTIAVLAIPLMLIGMTIIGIAMAIKSMATAISEMGVDNAMVTFMTTVNSVDDAKVENLEEMMDQAQRYVFIQAQMNAMELANSIADGIGSLFGIGGDEGSGGSQNQKEIVLKLNEREFARAVVESLDSESKISLA